eukprot:5465814-Prymnesium_polylepis.1
MPRHKPARLLSRRGPATRAAGCSVQAPWAPHGPQGSTYGGGGARAAPAPRAAASCSLPRASVCSFGARPSPAPVASAPPPSCDAATTRA